MMRLARLASIVVLLAFVARPSYAYLDPTSGSMILQAIVGGVAGAIVVIKMYWHRILGFFGVRKQHDEPPR